LLSDSQWERIEPLLSSSQGQRARPFRDRRCPSVGVFILLDKWLWLRP